MRTIIKYQADDGTEWAEAEAAHQRDRLIADVREATAGILKPRPETGSFRGYIKQDPARVLQYKAALLRLAQREIPDYVMNEHVADPSSVSNNSILVRILDEGGTTRPIAQAWWRLQTIDDEGREWEQPYYAINPGKGDQVEWQEGQR